MIKWFNFKSLKSMDWYTLLIGIFFIVCGIGSYVWLLRNTFLSPIQWYSPHNKAILITGCDSGIGNALAKHFHKQGFIVLAAVIDTNSCGARQLQTECPNRLHLIQMDITDDTQVNQSMICVQNYLKQYELSGLHALINNAGVCIMGEFDWLTWNQIQTIVDVNLLGTIRVIKTFLPLIINSKGRIINVSSVNGSVAYPGLSVYCATKFGIEGLSDSLRLEMLKFGVKVIVVKPGDYALLTNIVNNHHSNSEQMWREMDDNKRKIYGNYFSEYHKSVIKNKGYTSPKSFDKSSLFADFEESVLAVNPRLSITSASLGYRLFFHCLHFTPDIVRTKVLNLIFSNMFKFDVNH